MEPVIRPLGFDWKIGIGLLTSFAAREVMVATMATIYNVADAGDETVNLKNAMRNDIDEKTGAPAYTPLVALALMVFMFLRPSAWPLLPLSARKPIPGNGPYSWWLT